MRRSLDAHPSCTPCGRHVDARTTRTLRESSRDMTRHMIQFQTSRIMMSVRSILFLSLVAACAEGFDAPISTYGPEDAGPGASGAGASGGASDAGDMSTGGVPAADGGSMAARGGTSGSAAGSGGMGGAVGRAGAGGAAGRSGAGGAGGGSGAAGAAGRSSAAGSGAGCSNCSGCIPLLGSPCCKSNGTCGCSILGGACQ